ncbi:MAG: hypothetical protein ACRCZO_13600 [Cetobacterium sp.]
MSKKLEEFVKSKRNLCKKPGKAQRKRGKKVGGVNVIVHIDESKFCHKRKVM